MSTAPKPFAFILMPFSKEFDDTYELCIKPACEAAGAYAERVDKQIFQGSILDRVYNQISKADLIIADMTDRNPNVFYEVGYAHAISKTTILLTRKSDDIPFDLKHYPHILYEGSLTNLKRELERRVKWHLDNPREQEMTPEAMNVRVNGIHLINHPTIEIARAAGNKELNLNIELQNRADRRIKTVSCKIGLFAPIVFEQRDSSSSTRTFIIDANQRLFLPDIEFSLLPEMWDSIIFRPGMWNKTLKVGQQFEFCIRLYFDSGCTDFPFLVKIVS